MISAQNQKVIFSDYNTTPTDVSMYELAFLKIPQGSDLHSLGYGLGVGV